MANNHGKWPLRHLTKRPNGPEFLKKSMHQVRSVALAEITWQEGENYEFLMSSNYVPDYKTMEKFFPLAGLVDLREALKWRTSSVPISFLCFFQRCASAMACLLTRRCYCRDVSIRCSAASCRRYPFATPRCRELSHRCTRYYTNARSHAP